MHRLYQLRLGLLLACVGLAQGCSHFPPRAVESRPESRSIDPLTTTWGRHFAGLQAENAGLSGFHILQAGVDGIATRVQIVRLAERYLDLQYFIYRGDASGAFLTAELRRAAERGVKVRVLVDDGDTVSGDERILQLDGYLGAEVRVFNPFNYRGHNRLLRNLDFVLHKSRLDYRMHNKLMIADGAVALIGGRNIGDQYFQIDPRSQFADDDVFTVGSVVPSLSHSFEEFWNSELVVSAASLPRSKPGRVMAPSANAFIPRVESGEPLTSLISDPKALTWSSSRLLYDSPDKQHVESHERPGRLMSEVVERQMETVTNDLVMASPYFVPSDHELELLLKARARGSAVRILTNSLEATPEVAAHSGYVKVRVPLLKAGAKLYEVRARLDSTRGSGQGAGISRYGNYALHGKMYIFDRQQLFLGSWNYDQRSLRINTEIGLLIDSAALAGSVAHRFDDMVEPKAAYEVKLAGDGARKTRLIWETNLNDHITDLRVEPSRGWWPRLKAKCLAFLPLEPEL